MRLEISNPVRKSWAASYTIRPRERGAVRHIERAIGLHLDGLYAEFGATPAVEEIANEHMRALQAVEEMRGRRWVHANVRSPDRIGGWSVNYSCGAARVGALTL